MSKSYELYAFARDKKGLKDNEVSQRTGVSTATISNWKQGNYKPKADKLLTIAECVGMNPMELIKQED